MKPVLDLHYGHGGGVHCQRSSVAPPRHLLSHSSFLPVSNYSSSSSMMMKKLKKVMTSPLRQSNMPLRRFRGKSSTGSAAVPTRRRRFPQISASLILDLTEDNVKLVLEDARTEFSHIFDTSMGMTGDLERITLVKNANTGVAELVEVDGPFVKISLRGRFWHERSLILARLGNYLKQRIPEILEVDIEDEKQLDDSPENF